MSSRQQKDCYEVLGVPEFDSCRKGNLYLRIRVKVPARISCKERQLFEWLRELEKRNTRRK